MKLRQKIILFAIMHKLDLSVRTVKTHRLNIERKLGMENQADLIRFAVEHALSR